MKKLRHHKEAVKKDVSQDEESDDYNRMERKLLRLKNSKIKSKAKSELQVNDEYDADSEPDSKLDKKSENTKIQTVKKKKKKKRTRDLYQSMQDCIVSVKDCRLPIKKESPSKSIEYTKIKKYETDFSAVDSILPTSTEKMGSSSKRKTLKLKENITPPDTHSTPSNYSNVIRNLDDSFGFDEIERKLQFSSALSFNETGSQHKVPKQKYGGKRKYENEETIVDIIPMEPSKKRIVKPAKPADKVDENHEFWESLRMQFEEVEMHELVIEDC